MIDPTLDTVEYVNLTLPGQGEPIKADPITSAKEAEQAAIRAGTPNYSQLRRAYAESWTEIVEGDNFAEYLLSLVPQIVMLPRGDFQLPIVLSYLMLPSALCNDVPILESWGTSGSGKSELSKIACKIHDARPIGANSTATSLRNAVSNARFGEPVDGKRYEWERHTALAWEDVNPGELRKNDSAILNFLKLGVNRDSIMTIAGKDGVNIEFEPFSPKLVSSIHLLPREHDFRELVRRVIVVQHKKYQDWLVNDHSHIYEGMEPDELLDLSSYDWNGFSMEFTKFWSDPINLDRWTKAQQTLRKKRKHGIDKPLYKMSLDLMACGVVCGYWADENEAIDHMKAYWEWHYLNIESQASALQQVLKQFIQETTKDLEERNKVAMEAGREDLVMPVEINPTELRNFALQAISSGAVEMGTNQREVTTAMHSLGWKLSLNRLGQSRWVKSID